MFQKKFLSEVPYLALFLVTSFFLYTHTPNIGYDSPSYINFSVFRPLIYPVFIWLFHWAGKYQFNFVVWTQSILTFFSLLYARNWLKENLNISDYLIFFILLFVLITICFHFQMWYLESEGLSFPFFIFTFFLLIDCFDHFNLKKISYLALWVGILILTRLQFYYFYGVFVLLLAWYFWKKTSGKSLWICFSILLGSIFLITLIDHAYHYFRNGSFLGAPTIGSQLVIQPLFLANTGAENYFKNAHEKNTVQYIINEIHKQKLNNYSAYLSVLKPKYYEYAYEEYNRNYNAMQGIIYNTFKKLPPYELDKTTIDIAKTLFLHNIKINLFFYAWKIMDSFGGVPPFLFFCLLLLSVIYKIFQNKNEHLNLSQIFVALTIVITFANALLVAMVEPNCAGYFCYTQFLLYCLAALIADK